MKTGTKRLFAAMMGLVLLLSLAACGGKTSDEKAPDESKEQVVESTNAETFKIGVILPLTGNSARVGELQLAGVQYFVDYYNEQGGIEALGGAKIELLIADSTGAPETGVSELERLISEEGIQALTGPYNSNVAAALQPICEKYGIPFVMSNATTDSLLTGNNAFSFRCNQSNSHNALTMANFLEYINGLATTDEKIENVAFLYENTDWGVGSAAILTPLLEELGMKVVVSSAFEPGASDFSSAINQIKKAEADVILPLMQISDCQLFVQQVKEYKLDCLFLGYGGGFTVDDFLVTIGDDAEYMLTLNGYSADSLNGRGAVAEAINKKCKEELGCVMNEQIANGWLAVGVLVDGIEKAASTDGTAIAEAIAATDMAPGELATLMHPYGVKFGEVETIDGQTMTNQNVYASAVITQLLDSSWQLVYPEPQNSPLVWPAPGWDNR